MSDNKKCSNCGEIKKVNDFAFKNAKLNLRKSRCRACTKIDGHKHYLNNKDYYIGKAKGTKFSCRNRNLQYVIDYLKSHPCIDCGEADPMILEFDHVRGVKKYNISEMINKNSIECIDFEIAKCEVRCCNCHRRKTAKQLGWYAGIEF